MQSIERYGVIALLFLVVTVVAVVMWDTEEGDTSLRNGKEVVATAVPATKRPSSKKTTPRNSGLRTRAKTDERAIVRGAERRAPVKPEQLEPEIIRGAAPLTVNLPESIQATRESWSEKPARKTTERPLDTGRKQPKKRERIYVVRPGDTLGQIALDELGSSSLWPNLVQANPGLDPSRLQVGARLVLPPKPSTTKSEDPVVAKTDVQPPQSAPKTTGAVADGSYEVRSGDSLWRIADRALGNGERWREILAVNPGLDANRLNVGMTLKLPAGAKTAKSQPQEVAQASKKSSTPSQKGRVR